MSPSTGLDRPTVGAAALELRGVSKRFGGTAALDRVSVRFEAGLVHGLIGPNGSGKTTLVNVVSGLYGVDGGEILLGEARLDRRAPHLMASLGVVRTFQMPKSFGSLTVRENLLVPAVADHRREPLRAVEDRARRALESVRLAHLSEAPAASLSGGQTMLLQLARALMHEPLRLLLLDEPFAGVAPAIKERMIAAIHEINRARGATVVLVSHEMSTVRALCARVAVMSAGRVIAEGTLDEVARRPEVIEAYLGKPL